MVVTYRPATSDELRFVHATWTRSLYRERSDIACGLTERGFADCYRDAFAHAINVCDVWVAVIEDLVIGFVVSSAGNRLWYVYVSSRYRRLGIGAKLIADALGDTAIVCACVTPSWDKWGKKPSLWRWRPDLWRKMR